MKASRRNKLKILIAYFLVIYICFGIAWSGLFTQQFLTNLQTYYYDPRVFLVSLISIFPFPFLILLGIGLYMIYSPAWKAKYNSPKSKIILYLYILLLILFLGFFLRTIVPDNSNDDSLLLFLLESLAHTHLSLQPKSLASIFVFEFALPLGFLLFISSYWLPQGKNN